MKKKLKYNLESVSILRIKLVAAFSILFAVTFAIISLASYGVSKSIISGNIDIQTREVVEGHAAEIDQWLTRMLSIVNAYSHVIARGIPDDNGISSDLLNDFSRQSFFSDLYYGSVSGKFVSGKKWTPPPGYDPRKRPWYTTALKKGKTSMSDPYLDLETNTFAISVSSPVYNRDGSLRGVLSADLLLTTLKEKLEKISVNGKGHALLFNESGIALVHPDKSLTGTNILERPELKDAVKNSVTNIQSSVYYDSGYEILTVFTPVPSAGWTMGIVMTKNEVYSDLPWLASRFLLIFLVSLIVVVLTSKYFAGKLTFFMYLLEQTVEARTSELKEKIAEVEYLSLTDPLTGISNRRKIESVLKSEIDRTARTGKPLSVIMVDIDHFKQFNDTYGHGTGDRILKEFAVTVSRSLRSIDLAGRIGGEEFLVVCPETDIYGAHLVAEKLRTAVESMKIDSTLGITASFGCASLTQGDDADRLISRSDKALYRAKEHGRNRVESGI